MNGNSLGGDEFTPYLGLGPCRKHAPQTYVRGGGAEPVRVEGDRGGSDLGREGVIDHAHLSLIARPCGTLGDYNLGAHFLVQVGGPVLGLSIEVPYHMVIGLVVINALS